MACHEVRRGDEIGGADGGVAEAQVRTGVAARLLRVVVEVGLAVLVGVVTDDLHRVLVGAHRAVSTNAKELGLEHAFAAEGNLLHLRKIGEGDVVDDAQREVVLGLRQRKVVKHGDDLRRCGVTRTEAVASAYDERALFRLVEGILHVQIERLAVGTRLLGTVKHGYALHRLWNGSQQVLHREGTIEMDADHAHLLTLGVQVVDGLTGSIGGRAHEDNHTVGIFSTVV